VIGLSERCMHLLCSKSESESLIHHSESTIRNRLLFKEMNDDQNCQFCSFINI